MKKQQTKYIVLGIMTVLMALGFTACEDEPEVKVKLFVEGTWHATSVTGEVGDDDGSVSGTDDNPDWSITFDDDTYTLEGDAVIDSDGTYTVDGDDITLEPEIGIETTWEVEDINIDYMRVTSGSEDATIEIEFDKS